MYYFETASFSGRWQPQKSLTPPHIRSKSGQPDRIGSDIGPRVRGLVPVPDDCRDLSLDQLQAKIGFDAQRRATAQPDPQRPGWQAEDSGNT